MAPDSILGAMADLKIDPDEKPTEEMVNVRATVPHHIDNRGTMVEEQAGTGDPESLGG